MTINKFKKRVNIPNHYIFRDKRIEIEVPDKLSKCQDVCAKAIYENALLRYILQEKMNDEADYQKTILELDEELSRL